MTNYGCIHSIRIKVEKSWVAVSYFTMERDCMIQSGHSKHHACNGVHLLQICVWPSCVTPVTVNDGTYYVAFQHHYTIYAEATAMVQPCNWLSAIVMTPPWWCFKQRSVSWHRVLSDLLCLLFVLMIWRPLLKSPLYFSIHIH